MKRLAPVGLLILLLYNTFGLSFAVLLFPNEYRNASEISSGDDWLVVKMHCPSVPYTDDLQPEGTMNALVRRGDQFYNPISVFHDDDTLYVTLKSNQAARDRFFELAQEAQSLNNPDLGEPQNQRSKTIKLLTGLLKHYLPAPALDFPPNSFPDTEPRMRNSGPILLSLATSDLRLATPPPEQI